MHPYADEQIENRTADSGRIDENVGIAQSRMR
jgi:hypothetical protein